MVDTVSDGETTTSEAALRAGGDPKYNGEQSRTSRAVDTYGGIVKSISPRRFCPEARLDFLSLSRHKLSPSSSP